MVSQRRGSVQGIEGETVAKVTILAQTETVRVDSEKLESLYRQLGDVNAEDIVCRAMEELAVRLSQAEKLYRAGQFAELRKTARLIVAIAEQIGMQALSRGAGQVMDCVDLGDGTALAAVLARLIRIGERSLTQIWDIQDFSI